MTGNIPPLGPNGLALLRRYVEELKASEANGAVVLVPKNATDFADAEQDDIFVHASVLNCRPEYVALALIKLLKENTERE